MTQPSENTALSADRRRSLYKQCIGQVIEHLEPTSKQVFDRTAERLFELASSATNNVEQGRYFESMRILEKGRDQLIRRFVENLRKQATSFFSNTDAVIASRNDTQALSLDQMRIVDDRDLAQTLTVDAMTDSAEVRYSRELFALGTRVGLLLERPPLAVQHNPFGPRALSQGFGDAVAGVDIELEAVLTAFKVFDRHVMHQLVGLYETMNESLAKAGVAPQLKLQVKGKAATAPASTPEPQELEQATEDAAADNELEPVATASEPERAAKEEREVELYESIQNLLNARRPTAASPTPAAVASTPNLMDALEHLQQELILQDRLSSVAIKQQLLSQLGAQSDTNALVRNDENVLDTVGMMFDQIGTDSQLPEPIQVALSKLQIPYLKASLRQRDVLQSQTAAPRALLSELAQLGQTWNPQTDRGQRVLKTIADIVDDINKNYSDDDAVFKQKLAELREFSTKHERRAKARAKREQEAFEGREKLRQARSSVARQLLRLRGESRLPKLVNELLEKSWAHVMVLAMLRHGKDSEEFKQARATAQDLIWSVTCDHKKPDDVKRLRTRLPILTKTLAKGLREVGYQDDDIRKVLDNLKSTYKGMMTGDTVILESSDAGLVIRGESVMTEEELATVQDATTEEELADFLSEVKGWQPGQWVLFNRDNDEPLRAKLSWVSPITGRYLFVDQQGQKAVERSAAELASEIEQQLCQTMDNQDLVSRALHSVASNLAQQTAAQSTDD